MDHSLVCPPPLWTLPPRADFLISCWVCLCTRTLVLARFSFWTTLMRSASHLLQYILSLRYFFEQYLSGADDLSPFADSLLRVGRQQCHLNTSVVVSTQDPTFVPAKLLELCSFIFAHRFASPKWLHYLAQYVPMSNADAGKLLSQVHASLRNS